LSYQAKSNNYDKWVSAGEKSVADETRLGCELDNNPIPRAAARRDFAAPPTHATTQQKTASKNNLSRPLNPESLQG
jgi:hypothetical protein